MRKFDPSYRHQSCRHSSIVERMSVEHETKGRNLLAVPFCSVGVTANIPASKSGDLGSIPRQSAKFILFCHIDFRQSTKISRMVYGKSKKMWEPPMFGYLVK
jgi:hypothetical protein